MPGEIPNLNNAFDPFFGLPTRKDVSIPRSTPWSIQIVRVNDQSETMEKLNLVAIPLELTMDSIANWETIPSIGRNNPFYNYTGGEDNLEFTIDWYSQSQDNKDVISNCRWVDSLTRADAYRKEPDRVIILWGELFRFTTWIVTSAPYRLSIFNRKTGILPLQAYQDVTLRKVTTQNTSIEDRRRWPQ